MNLSFASVLRMWGIRFQWNLWIRFQEGQMVPLPPTPSKKSNVLNLKKSVLRIRIRDPGLGAFLTTGSRIRDPGWGKVSIRIRDPG
jgi:hypothetical protein